MNEQIRISGKDLGAIALADFCPRCFWIRLHCKGQIPFQIFPGIFSSIDGNTKRVIHTWFDDHGGPPPWLNDLKGVVGYKEPPTFHKFNTVIKEFDILLTGSPDGVFICDDDSHMIIDYKTASLEKECANQLKAITELLPGATTAGLAHSFDARRQTFLRPHNVWQWLFVGSLVAIVLVALTGFLQEYKMTSAPTYDELFRLWLCRLPIVAALVWLALHASREAALAKRLEEDYGYKAAIAEAFLGFHKQMTEIGESATTNKPLAQLCEDTLTTIATPPGRIYDKHALTVKPTDELKEAAKAAAPVIEALKPK
jgi:hypothetical protein